MDTNKDFDRKLELERVKLDKLVDEALKNGTPLSETHDIMWQSRKVNELIQKAQEQKKSGNHIEPER